MTTFSRTTALAAAIVLLACDRGPTAADKAVSRQADLAMPAVAAAPSASPAPAPRPVQTRSLIRTGELRIKVGDAVSAMQRLNAIATQFGGELADSRLSQDADAHHFGSAVLRVPADRFAEAMQSFHAIGEIKDQSSNAQDVTREFTDLETRVRVKTQMVRQLQDILEKRAGKLSDVLDVERELARATTELEQLEGEHRFYASQIALASISVTIFETESQSSRFAAALSDALSGSTAAMGRSLGGMIYAAMISLPWIALAALVWFAVVRRITRRVSHPLRLTVDPAAE